MKKNITKMRGMRLSEATYKAVVQAAKARDYASPSAFMRTAVEKECAVRTQQSVNPNSASVRLWKSIRSRSAE